MNENEEEIWPKGLRFRIMKESWTKGDPLQPIKIEPVYIGAGTCVGGSMSKNIWYVILDTGKCWSGKFSEMEFIK